MGEHFVYARVGYVLIEEFGLSLVRLALHVSFEFNFGAMMVE